MLRSQKCVKFLFFSSMYISESKNQEKETEDGDESKTDKERVLTLSIYLFSLI